MSERKDLFQIRKEIGLRLRQVRKAMGFTQNELVQLLKIDRIDLSRMENGELSPPPLILYALSENHHVSLDWLITGLGEMFQCEIRLTFRDEVKKYCNPVPLRVMDDSDIS